MVPRPYCIGLLLALSLKLGVSISSKLMRGSIVIEGPIALPRQTDKNILNTSIYTAGLQMEQHGNPQKASFYGPGSCVITYLSPAGTCVMQTKCSGVDPSLLENYDYGLTCVANDGRCVRHFFGVNSFDEEETFDTKIQCSLCMGVAGSLNDSLLVKVKKRQENMNVNASLSEEIASNFTTVFHDISQLTSKVDSLSNKIEVLESSISNTTASPPPAGTTAAPSSEGTSTSTPTTTSTSLPQTVSSPTTNPSSATQGSSNGFFERVNNEAKPLVVTKRIIKKSKTGDTVETIEYGVPRSAGNTLTARRKVSKTASSDDETSSSEDDSADDSSVSKTENFASDYDDAEGSDTDGDE